MPKTKTHRASAKRFKVTGTGRLLRRRGFRAHLLRKKPTTHTRRLGRPAEIKGGQRRQVRRALSL